MSWKLARGGYVLVSFCEGNSQAVVNVSKGSNDCLKEEKWSFKKNHNLVKVLKEMNLEVTNKMA